MVRLLLLSCSLFLLAAGPVLAETGEQRFPDVVEVTVRATGDGVFRFDVTLSSPYDSPERYADAFRVLGLDGETLGVRELLHHHANEQPFTRSLTGVEIPPGVRSVVVEGRDQDHGYGGQRREVSLPGR